MTLVLENLGLHKWYTVYSVYIKRDKKGPQASDPVKDNLPQAVFLPGCLRAPTVCICIVHTTYYWIRYYFGGNYILLHLIKTSSLRIIMICCCTVALLSFSCVLITSLWALLQRSLAFLHKVLRIRKQKAARLLTSLGTTNSVNPPKWVCKLPNVCSFLMHL